MTIQDRDLAVALQKRLRRADEFDSFLDGLQKLISRHHFPSGKGTPTEVGTLKKKRKRKRKVISDDEVRQLRKDHAKGNMTNMELGEKYGIAPSSARGIAIRSSRRDVR